MNPLDTLCLAAIVFLSLPLPVFASAVLGVRPAARRSLLPWVWANAITSAALGLSMVTGTVPPIAATALVGVAFVICGAAMFRGLAKSLNGKQASNLH